MGKFVEPKVYLLGYTIIDKQGMEDYLKDTNNLEFLESINKAKEQGLSDGEILCSFYAKLCYLSLTIGKNENISKVRDIFDNLVSCFNQAHGSVFECCMLNFVVHNGSRVFEPELIRHRAGTHFSVESGRFKRTAEFGLVHDPILNCCKEEISEFHQQVETLYQKLVSKLNLDNMKDFDQKKKLTSALRRILPEGKAKEIGFSANIRALRHMVQLRTSRHAEWEIRKVFEQVYLLTKEKFPLLYYGAKEELVHGILEITGMKMQPYEKI